MTKCELKSVFGAFFAMKILKTTYLCTEQMAPANKGKAFFRPV